MTKNWVHRVGHSPVCQILLQIAMTVMITSSLPAYKGTVLLGCCQLQLTSLSSMIVLQSPLLCITCVCLGTVQYWWISIGLVIIQLRTVFCPSVQYLSSFCDIIDFKKAFDGVWHAALWVTMKKYNVGANLIKVIKHLYDKATSAVLSNGSNGDWFWTTVGLWQGCLLSTTLFNTFLERIITDA